jgi:phenylalanyl-tRNA synthetase alpha chain
VRGKLEKQIEQVEKEFFAGLQTARSVREVEQLRILYLGRKGPVHALLHALRDAPETERPIIGKRINELKERFEQLLAEHQGVFAQEEESSRIVREKIDVTLPGRRRWVGGFHPITAMLDELLTIFMEMGFSVQYGPEIESDYYNFEALNFGPDHPARDMQDTFFIAPHVLLRTHTSPTQIRVMERHTPPIRVVAPGRAFRNEDVTPRSHVFFHQIEGFYIDKGVSFADLMQTIEAFLTRLLGSDIQLRFRPSYFPFVEPGLEVDVRCQVCSGKGCSLCKHSGWLELLGSGMIHPEVLRAGGVDPEEFTGYAWGLGIERLVLRRYGIPDIRMLSDNDLRLLAQFRAA